MQKPLTMLIDEFRAQIEIALNNSNLPWWKIRDELEYVVLPQVKNMAVKEEQAEKKAYLEYIASEKQKLMEDKRKERVEQKGSE